MKLKLSAFRDKEGKLKYPEEIVPFVDPRVIGVVIKQSDGSWINYYSKVSGIETEQGDSFELIKEDDGLTLSQAVKRIQTLVG